MDDVSRIGFADGVADARGLEVEGVVIGKGEQVEA